MDYLSQILARFTKIELSGKLYLLDRNPSWDLQEEGRLCKQDILRKCRFNLLRKQDLEKVYIRLGLLEPNFQEEIINLKKSLDRLKIRLYQFMKTKGDQKKTRKQIKAVKNKIEFMENTLYYINQHSVEGFAEKSGNDLVLAKSFYSPNKRKVTAPLFYLDEANLLLAQATPTIEEIRQTARQNFVQTLWMTKKGSILKVSPPNHLQTIFLSFLRTYEGIYKHPECPKDEIIEDDDALDGWLLLQRGVKQEGEEKVSDKVRKHKNIFITAENQDEADAIYASNEGRAALQQKLRLKALQQGGAINEAKFNKMKRQVLGE